MSSQHQNANQDAELRIRKSILFWIYTLSSQICVCTWTSNEVVSRRVVPKRYTAGFVCGLRFFLSNGWPCLTARVAFMVSLTTIRRRRRMATQCSAGPLCHANWPPRPRSRRAAVVIRGSSALYGKTVLYGSVPSRSWVALGIGRLGSVPGTSCFAATDRPSLCNDWSRRSTRCRVAGLLRGTRLRRRRRS